MSSIDLRSAQLRLIDFVPDSIASDPEIVALSKAIDPELRRVANAVIEAVILPRISQLPEAILDELGWSFRLTELQLWDGSSIMSAAERVAAKRSLLVTIFAIRKKSGTKFAVRRIFDLLSVTGEIVEWFEEGGSPYTYRIRIVVGDVGVTLAQLEQIPELTHRFEPARCQLSELAVETDRLAPLLLYPVVTAGLHISIPFGGP